MRMRRFHIIVLISLFLAGAAYSGTAFAADDGVTVAGLAVTPTSLAGDGQVQVNVNVAVSLLRSAGITGAYIDGPGVDTASETRQDIQVGDNRNLSCALHVSSAQLGSSIQLSVKWDGESAGNTFSVTVSPQNQVIFTRTISPDKPAISKGDSVTVTYTVRNSGSADITNVQVDDGGLPGMPQKADAIAAGQTQEFKSSFPMSTDFTSSPKLTYKLGGESHTMTCSARTESLRNAQLDASLSAVPGTVSSGGNVMLVCDLKNTGNVKLTNLVISDGAGNIYYTLPSLDKNGTYTYTRMVTLTQTAQFQFTVTAKDDSGVNSTYTTNETEVKVTASDGQYSVTLSANADALQLAQPGPVNFNISISNNGANAILNAVLKDQDGNTVTTFPSLPPGDTQYTYTAAVNATAQFKFTIEIPGDKGEYKAESSPVEVRIAVPTATPSAIPTATADGQITASAKSTQSGGLGWLVKILLVIVALIVITVIVLVALTVAEKRRGFRKR